MKRLTKISIAVLVVFISLSSTTVSATEIDLNISKQQLHSTEDSIAEIEKIIRNIIKNLIENTQKLDELSCRKYKLNRLIIQARNDFKEDMNNLKHYEKILENLRMLQKLEILEKGEK